MRYENDVGFAIVRGTQQVFDWESRQMNPGADEEEDLRRHVPPSTFYIFLTISLIFVQVPPTQKICIVKKCVPSIIFDSRSTPG